MARSVSQLEGSVVGELAADPPVTSDSILREIECETLNIVSDSLGCAYGTWWEEVYACKAHTQQHAIAVLCLVASAALPSLAQDQTPVFVITTDDSEIKFYVKASVAVNGKFDKWDAAITFTSPDVSTGVLDIKIQAESVNTGSGMKDGKLKSKDFFDVKQDPLITFHSDKSVQTGPTTFDVPGTFTIRGVSKPETLTFTVSGAGTGSGEIKGTMAFDRKDYGMTKGIPFVTIADRIEVTVDLKGKRVSGPPLVFKQ